MVVLHQMKAMVLNSKPHARPRSMATSRWESITHMKRAQSFAATSATGRAHRSSADMVS
ncbi:hypothetical protein D3C72_2330870 [compost metagenome]